MIKRIFDLLGASVLMILMLPIMLVVAVTIRVMMGKSVIFKQKRPGQYGMLFEMYKFRTMKNMVDRRGSLLPDGQRLTKFGGLLRSTSMDELPELWNVLKGDMSLVGPRPLLTEYLPLYTDRQNRRHEVKPGITGWAQVNGRNSLSWNDKFELDVWYVDNHSFILDLRIMAMTFIKLIKREGINARGEATMSRFTGSSDGITK